MCQRLSLHRASSSGDGSGSGRSTKSSAPTVATACVDSSEEFTFSAELSTTAAEEEHSHLQFSGLSIVDELRQVTPASTTTHDDENNNNRQVRFVDEATYIDEEALALARNACLSSGIKKKHSRKSSRSDMDASSKSHAPQGEGESEEGPVPPQVFWWSPEELKSIEMNALYMVKECQQYQEEVVCTVLYNKAFLTAANLAKTVSEDELEEFAKDIGPHTQNLESWTAVGQCRRGLEKFVSEKSTEHAIQTRKEVLQFQQGLREATATCESQQQQSEVMAQHADALALRCQESSRTARIMARMMGQADRDSLDKAETLCQETLRLPEPPGVYDHLDYHRATPNDDMDGSKGDGQSRRTRRSSIIKPIKKAIGNVFRRQGSEEVQRKRIIKMQQRQMAEQTEPEKRPSQEFRRSFLDNLEYGEQ